MGYSIFYSADGSVYAVNEPAQMNTSASVVGKDGAVIWRLDDIPVPSLESGGSFPVIRVYPTQGDLHLDYVAYRLASEEVERLDNVLLDDTHPYIEYDAPEADAFVREDNASTPVGFPLNGTWTRSDRAGSSFTTRFRGAFNVAVYGVLRHTRGRLSLNYTLNNGVTETKNYFDSTQAANATKWSFQKLYEHTFPRDQHFKNHKLEVTLAACTDDQTFYLDYITYQASDHQESTIPPSESDIGGDAKEASRLSDDDRGFSGASIGAIVGAIVGFIFFIAVSFRFVKLRRRQIQKRNAAQSGLNYREFT
ncbi:hypothetical protein FA13DRAFT_78737 [Coprinellus micaceus]|uniref:Uncharacterized protein n=1 Tax=Coprinellus micaceus TaxID=71717 RepID=A0A4Y7TLA1_COPMI|nr:hypothetical protein FA13DRAFT_78737 [Coprinellus micaceus]